MKLISLLLILLLVFLTGCSKELLGGQYNGGGGRAWKIVFFPDGERFAIGEVFQQGALKITITIINGTTGEKQLLGSYEGSLDSLTVSSDGKYVATANNGDKKIRLWDVQTKQMLTVAEGIYPRGLVFSSDGKQLISSGLGEVNVWNIDDRKKRGLFKCAGSTNADHLLAISQDGNNLVTPCKSDDTGILKLIDFKTGNAQTVRTTDISSDIRFIAFSPDGKTIALTVSNGPLSNMESKSIRLVNIQTGEMKILGECENEIETFTFSPDGKSLASGDSGNIKVWNIETKQSRIVKNCNDSVSSLSFSPTGKHLGAACGKDTFFILQL